MILDIILLLAGGALIVAMLILSSLWMGRSARRSTEEAVHTVSNFYLEELAGRTYLIVELGLQSVFDRTGEIINRCHTYADFLNGYNVTFCY